MNVIDSAGVVEADTPCHRCGYSLHTLRSDAACPECGIPAHSSLGPNILCRCERAWILQRASDMRVIMWVTSGYAILDLIFAKLPTPASPHGILWQARSVFIAESLAVLFLATVHWRMSRASYPSLNKSISRYSYRVGILLAVGGKLASCLLLFLPSAALAGTMMNWISNVGIVIGTFGFLARVRELAIQIPSDSLAQAARLLFWSLGLLLMTYAGLAMGVQLSLPNPTRLSKEFADIVIVLFAGLIIGASFGIGLLARIRRQFILRAHSME